MGGDFLLSANGSFSNARHRRGCDLLGDQEAKRPEIGVVSTLIAALGARRKFFRYATGMTGYAGVLEHAPDRRFGVIPLVLKNINLSATISIRIFIVAEQEAFSGRIIWPLTKGKESTPVPLFVGNGGRI
jgi:hypothetical protein